MHKLVAVSLFLGLLQGCGTSHSPVAPTPPPIPSPTPTPTPSAPLPIVGAYRFEITVDPKCQDRFPKAFRIRSYDVDIRPAGEHSDIWFNSPNVHHLPQTNLAPGTGFMSEGFFRLSFLFEDVVPLDQPSPYTFIVSARAGIFLEPPNGPETIGGPLYADLKYADPAGTARCESLHYFIFSPR
jgi:hypothetical protein